MLAWNGFTRPREQACTSRAKSHPCLAPDSPGSNIQIEKLDGIGSSNLQAIRFGDGGGVEPVRRVVGIFKGPVAGKEDSIGTHFQYGVYQGLGSKVARRGEIEIVLEVLADA